MSPLSEQPTEAHSWWDLGLVVGIALAAVLALFVVMHVVRRRLLPRLTATGSTALQGLAAALDAIRMRYIVPIAVVLAADFLVESPRAHFWLQLAVFALIGLQVALAVNRLIVSALRHATAPAPGQTRPVMFTVVTWSVQFLIWLTLVLAVLASGGINITAFVASLGVGGIAVALALQNILGDLFASISIGLDKPFEPGDSIAFDGTAGEVSHIGVKSTRIISQSGEELSIANSQLLAKLTHNYSRMAERRVVFAFTVPFASTRGQLATIVERVSALITAVDGVRFDRGHVKAVTDAGFALEFVYYLADSDYTLYCDVHQRVIGETVDVLAELDVPFAVPARAVTVDGR